MKAYFIILLQFICCTLYAQHTQTQTFALRKPIATYTVDSINGAVVLTEHSPRKESIIVAIKPLYICQTTKNNGKKTIERISDSIYDYPLYNYLLITSGEYVKINEVIGCVINSDAFWNWRNIWNVEYFSLEKKAREEKERKQKEDAEANKISDFYAGQINMSNRIKAAAKAITWHEYITVFTDKLEVNTCHSDLLAFVEKYMKMNEQSNNYENGYITSRFVQRTSKGNPESITVRYKVKNESHYFFSEQVEITGTPRRVIELFVTYWPTKIHINEVKKNRRICLLHVAG
jgi:hypothetical protein